MSRPLVISDCDEVLLHMVAPFRDWLNEERGVDFHMGTNDFSQALRWQADGAALAQDEIWRELREFFETEMHRQHPIEGSVAAMNRLSDHADVVILTNLLDKHQEGRAKQLLDHGLEARVFTNQGPKGPALKAIIEEYSPSRAIFIDDLAQHHRSARETLETITTLHFCGEPLLAPHIDCAHKAGHADARIDRWDEALPWLLDSVLAEALDKEDA
uniref:HAD family hydrolase n=1 Tax=Parerythrobacter lutipelagi TaxID=1964208 RepID=UPI0010F456D7|nr:HAD family hydrolase [Parerythrobacter lutipelagi]